MGTSLVLSFVLALGIFAAAADHAMAQAQKQSQKANARLTQQMNQLNQAAQNAIQTLPATPLPMAVAPSTIRSRSR